MNPITVNFTNEIFDYIYDFMFSSCMNHRAPVINEETVENNALQEQLDRDYLYKPDSYLKQVCKNVKKSKKKVKTKDQEQLIPHYFHRFRINANQVTLNYNTSNILTVK